MKLARGGRNFIAARNGALCFNCFGPASFFRACKLPPNAKTMPPSWEVGRELVGANGLSRSDGQAVDLCFVGTFPAIICVRGPASYRWQCHQRPEYGSRPHTDEGFMRQVGITLVVCWSMPPYKEKPLLEHQKLHRRSSHFAAVDSCRHAF
jgi:hypothetical protein